VLQTDQAAATSGATRRPCNPNSSSQATTDLCFNISASLVKKSFGSCTGLFPGISQWCGWRLQQYIEPRQVIIQNSLRRPLIVQWSSQAVLDDEPGAVQYTGCKRQPHHLGYAGEQTGTASNDSLPNLPKC